MKLFGTNKMMLRQAWKMILGIFEAGIDKPHGSHAKETTIYVIEYLKKLRLYPANTLRMIM